MLLYRQGESGKASYNNGVIGSNGSDNANWGKAVREIYDNLLIEINPFKKYPRYSFKKKVTLHG